MTANKTIHEQEHLTVVELVTTAWHNKNGFFYKRQLRPLKKFCKGYQILEEDSLMIGFQEVYKTIIDIDKKKDGIYKVILCNLRTDWETGHVDDYEYRLIPYKPQNKKI